MARWLPLALVPLLLVPLVASAGETRKVTVRGAGVLYGEVMEAGEEVVVTTITGEVRRFPKKSVLRNESMSESGPLSLSPEPMDELVVDGDAKEAPEKAPAPKPAAAPAPATPVRADLMERIKNDPALLQELVSIINEDPALAAALSDPTVLAAAASRDPGSAANNELVRKLEANPRFRAVVARLAAE